MPGRDERARGGAPFRGLTREREEDARVLRPAGVPTHSAGAPSEARWIYRTHRRVAAGRSQGRASQAAAHREAHLRASSRRARVHRRVHDREGPCSRASSPAPGDVRAAGSSAGARAGRFRRSAGVHRRGQAEGPFLRLRPAAQRRIVRSGIPCGDGRGMGRRARARVLVLRHGAIVDSLRQRPVPGVADRARRDAPPHAAVQRISLALPHPGPATGARARATTRGRWKVWWAGRGAISWFRCRALRASRHSTSTWNSAAASARATFFAGTTREAPKSVGSK